MDAFGIIMIVVIVALFVVIGFLVYQFLSIKKTGVRESDMMKIIMESVEKNNKELMKELTKYIEDEKKWFQEQSAELRSHSEAQREVMSSRADVIEKRVTQERQNFNAVVTDVMKSVRANSDMIKQFAELLARRVFEDKKEYMEQLRRIDAGSKEMIKQLVMFIQQNFVEWKKHQLKVVKKVEEDNKSMLRQFVNALEQRVGEERQKHMDEITQAEDANRDLVERFVGTIEQKAQDEKSFFEQELQKTSAMADEIEKKFNKIIDDKDRELEAYKKSHEALIPEPAPEPEPEPAPEPTPAPEPQKPDIIRDPGYFETPEPVKPTPAEDDAVEITDAALQEEPVAQKPKRAEDSKPEDASSLFDRLTAGSESDMDVFGGGSGGPQQPSADDPKAALSHLVDRYKYSWDSEKRSKPKTLERSEGVLIKLSADVTEFRKKHAARLNKQVHKQIDLVEQRLREVHGNTLNSGPENQKFWRYGDSVLTALEKALFLFTD